MCRRVGVGASGAKKEDQTTTSLPRVVGTEEEQSWPGLGRRGSKYGSRGRVMRRPLKAGQRTHARTRMRRYVP